MRRYETIFIIRPTIAEDDITGIIEKVNSIIEGDGGTFIRIDKWGLKKLAYLIKKENQGYYVYVDYAGMPASVKEMERIFRIDDRILKYLTVKLADSCDPDAEKELLAQEEQAAEAPAVAEEAETAPAAEAPPVAAEAETAPAAEAPPVAAEAETEQAAEAPPVAAEAETEEVAESPPVAAEAETEEVAESPAETAEITEEETSAAAEEEKAE